MAGSSTERLLRRTRARLFLVTLALLTLLVVGVGAATALMGLSALDADVDRALGEAVAAQAAALPSETPAPGGSDAEDEGGADAGEATEGLLGFSNTAVLVLDPQGTVVANRTGVTLRGVPDSGSVEAARATGSDLRTVDTGSGAVRVLTRTIVDGARVEGFIQGGFDMRLHDAQSRSLVIAILVVGVLALLAAAVIAFAVTGRALVPIREGFETQRRFVADASHELRTPAALIRANAEVLEREGLVATDGRDLLTDIVGEADRLGGLVGDLLQLAAWDETRLVVAPSPVDVAQVARETVRGATAMAAERGVSLEVEAPEAAMAPADRARLVQLLLILVDNAVDHSPSGGTVAVRVRGEAGAVLVDVDDQGPGIPVADRERIFEPFTRLPGATRHGSGGTGLGLAIARRIAEAHGGSVDAGAPPAGGARFTVRLPVRPGG